MAIPETVGTAIFIRNLSVFLDEFVDGHCGYWNCEPDQKEMLETEIGRKRPDDVNAIFERRTRVVNEVADLLVQKERMVAGAPRTLEAVLNRASWTLNNAAEMGKFRELRFFVENIFADLMPYMELAKAVSDPIDAGKAIRMMDQQGLNPHLCMVQASRNYLNNDFRNKTVAQNPRVGYGYVYRKYWTLVEMAFRDAPIGSRAEGERKLRRYLLQNRKLTPNFPLQRSDTVIPVLFCVSSKDITIPQTRIPRVVNLLSLGENPWHEDSNPEETYNYQWCKARGIRDEESLRQGNGVARKHWTLTSSVEHLDRVVLFFLVSAQPQPQPRQLGAHKISPLDELLLDKLFVVPQGHFNGAFIDDDFTHRHDSFPRTLRDLARILIYHGHNAENVLVKSKLERDAKHGVELNTLEKYIVDAVHDAQARYEREKKNQVELDRAKNGLPEMCSLLLPAAVIGVVSEYAFTTVAERCYLANFDNESFHFGAKKKIRGSAVVLNIRQVEDRRKKLQQLRTLQRPEFELEDVTEGQERTFEPFKPVELILADAVPEQQQ